LHPLGRESHYPLPVRHRWLLRVGLMIGGVRVYSSDFELYSLKAILLILIFSI